MATEITTGDSRPYIVDLAINDETFSIPPSTSVVKAAIVSADQKTALTASPITLVDTTIGADWTKSKLVVKFPKAATASITTTGKAFLEIQVTLKNPDALLDDDDWTWFIPIVLKKGNIA